MKRVAVKVAYLGDNFHGSQRQPEWRGLRTVESEILERLRYIEQAADDDIDLRLASRTDSGVSALGNVIVFNTSFEDNFLLLKALNAVSKGVHYLAVAEVPANFDPRKAWIRGYRYSCPADGIDLKKFEEAAKVFEGHHDFKRFARLDKPNRSTVVVIQSVKVREIDGVIETEFRAEFFLWNMIRRIMAAVIQVGKGMSSLDDVLSKLAGDDGTFGIAPAEGLTLLGVEYEDVDFLTPADCPYEKAVSHGMFKNRLVSEFYSELSEYGKE